MVRAAIREIGIARSNLQKPARIPARHVYLAYLFPKRYRVPFSYHLTWNWKRSSRRTDGCKYSEADTTRALARSRPWSFCSLSVIYTVSFNRVALATVLHAVFSRLSMLKAFDPSRM